MAITPLETDDAAELRGPGADVWRTLAAWLWMTYIALLAGAMLWWLL